MGDKDGFAGRVNALNVNVDALDSVSLQGNWKIPNADGKRNSLQIYAAITTNDSYIGPSEAARGLEIFGDELRAEARQNPGKHPNIDLLEEVVKTGSSIKSFVHRRPSAKPLPFSEDELKQVAAEFGTPFIIYDERGIRQTARDLKIAFSWVAGGFRNYFAVKACPNPTIMSILKEEGMGADCSSMPELMLAEAVGLTGEQIMFTSNRTPAEEFAEAKRLGAVVNFDDITHIPFFEKHVGSLPELACCRYNPGKLREGGSAIIGTPEEAKYGFTREQITEGFKMLKAKGVKRFGLHTMIVSNETREKFLIGTGEMMFRLANDISWDAGIKFDFVNLGGGIGTPYKPEQRPVDLKMVGEGIREQYEKLILRNGHKPLKVVMENGRTVTGPHGVLVTAVRHVEQKHKYYIGVDACMANLMRPGMYGAYHHVTAVGKENEAPQGDYDIVGSLCENNDKFAVNRPMPLLVPGDLLAIHNAGAHGHAMCFQYNGKLRGKELLRREDGSVELIRRAETPEDYFSTLDFPGSKFAALGGSIDL